MYIQYLCQSYHVLKLDTCEDMSLNTQSAHVPTHYEWQCLRQARPYFGIVHAHCSEMQERIQELLRVVNCKHAKAILYLMHCMSKTERICMHYMSKTIVCLYAAPYVQNFCLYALHVQAKLGVDEAIKPGIGPPRGRLQGKIEDFWFNKMSV